MKFLSENLKAKGKIKNMKSQEWYEKLPEKKSIYIYFLFIHLFIYFLVEKVQSHLRNSPPHVGLKLPLLL